MISTPKPNRAPLSAAEYQTLRQLEDDIAALKAARAPVAEIGRKVAELKRGGLWRRSYNLRGLIDNDGPMRFSTTWETYCRNWLPYTRRYCDQVIRLAGETISTRIGTGARKRAISRDLSTNGDKGTYEQTVAFRLTAAQNDIFKAMMAFTGIAVESDFMRTSLQTMAAQLGFAWPN